MPDTFNVGANYAIKEIAADYMTMFSDQSDPMFSVLPIEAIDSAQVLWEIFDNTYGVMSLRGLDGSPNVIQPQGYQRYSMPAGYYGERCLINENEMTVGRAPGTPNEVYPVKDMISQRLKLLVQRACDSVRLTIATIGTTGRFSNRNATGAVVHTGAVTNFNLFAPSVPWTTAATATPIQDIIGWNTTLSLGTSSKWGSASKMYMSSPTLNAFMATAQILGTYKSSYGASPLGIKGVNDILGGYNLPQIEVYDEGYYPTLIDAANRTNFIRFLPAGKIFWAGTRPGGQKIGKFVMTRNAVNMKVESNNPDLSGAFGTGRSVPIGANMYTLLDYRQMPPLYTLDAGFNGGPKIEYPSAIAGVAAY